MVSRRKNIFDNCHDRKHNSFPEVRPFSISHMEIPPSYDIYEETEEEYGFMLTPFIKNDYYRYNPEIKRNYDIASRVARCSNSTCTAYINPFCEHTSARWICSLCKHRNTFTKAQTRYRNLNPKTLPELQEELVDYRMPLSEGVSVIPNQEQTGRKAGEGYQASLFSKPIAERPLVHVFVIQESMALDTLQSVMEALTVALRDMHPEIQVVLLTFSYRIGVYRFKKGSMNPSIQYIPFVAVRTTDNSDNSNSSSILEGHGLHDLPAEYSIKLLLPIETIVNFRTAACSLGDCEDSITAAVSSLFDAFSSETSSLSESDHHIPQVLIGPTLDALSVWLTGCSPAGSTSDSTYCSSASESVQDTGYTDADHFNSSEASRPRDLVSLFSNLTMNLWSGVTGQNINTTTTGSSTTHATPAMSGSVRAAKRCPMEHCTGVIIHVFIDAAQDLPVGTHDSVEMNQQPVSPSTPTTTIPSLINSIWEERLATHLSNYTTTVNIYSIVNYESTEVGLNSYQQLTSRTGGVLHRAVLGLNPIYERKRFNEYLRRIVSTNYATKCILKVRTPHMIEIDPNSITGGMIPDKELPGIYRIATCTPEKTFGMNFHYTVKHNNTSKPTPELAFQMAFSYEVIAETNELLTTTVEDEETEKGLAAEEEDDHVSLYTDSSMEPTSDNERMFPEDRHDSSKNSSKQMHIDSNNQTMDNEEPSTSTKTTISQKSTTSTKSFSKVYCGMYTDSAGYYENSMEELGLGDVHNKLTQYYHIADATLNSRRTAASYPQYMHTQDGVMLPPHTTREPGLIKTNKLVVIKYLRVYTIHIPCSMQILQILANVDTVTHVTLLMRQAIYLERNYRFNHSYTINNTNNSSNGNNNINSNSNNNSNNNSNSDSYAVKAFTNKINMQSPGITYLVNCLVKRIICITQHYALEKEAQKYGKNLPLSSKKRPVSDLLRSAETVETLLQEVLAYPVVRDMMIYTYAAIEKLTYYTPTLCVPKNSSSAIGNATTSYVNDEGITLESMISILDSHNIARILHPLLVPVSEDMRLQEEFLPLTRKSIVTTGNTYYFIDSGLECILYRSTNNNTTTATTSSSNSTNKFEHLLELSKADEKTLDLCMRSIAKVRKINSINTQENNSTTTADTIATTTALAKEEDVIVIPKIINHMYDSSFLLGYLQRRVLNLETVPRIQYCEAGSNTASVFARYLLEDHSDSGLMYAEFIDFIVAAVREDLLTEQ